MCEDLEFLKAYYLKTWVSDSRTACITDNASALPHCAGRSLLPVSWVINGYVFQSSSEMERKWTCLFPYIWVGCLGILSAGTIHYANVIAALSFLHSKGDCFCSPKLYLTKIWKYLVYIFTAIPGFLRDHFKVLDDGKQISYLIPMNWGQHNICFSQLCYHLYFCSVCLCLWFILSSKSFFSDLKPLVFPVSIFSSCFLP